MICYKLAKFYGLDPDLFLAKKVSDIRRHDYWTEKMLEAVAPAGDE